MIPKTHDLFDKLFASRTDLCDKYPSCPSTSPLLPFPYAPLLLVYKKLTLHIYGSDFVKITKPGMLPEIWDNKEYNPIKLCLDPGNLPPLLFSLPPYPRQLRFPLLMLTCSSLLLLSLLFVFFQVTLQCGIVAQLIATIQLLPKPNCRPLISVGSLVMFA